MDDAGIRLHYSDVTIHPGAIMTRLMPLAAAAALFGALIPSTAEACGGFFCSTVPIDQSKERIVFAIDEPNEKVEAHIQIFYQGAAEEFAWIVPVPSIPEMGLSTDQLFQQLEWMTAPQFLLDSQQIGDCTWDSYPPFAMEDDADFGTAANGAGGGTGGGVVVVAESQVGPYDQVTLAANDSGELLEWLNDNGYLIPTSIQGNLDPYVAGGSYFVAIKLQKDQDAGDITPVKMTYTASSAMIPLVLTAIAATPDMRLQPYVFSTARAVPDNYLHVKVNEAAVNWLQWGSNYDEVITLAADEAGGQAFATDYAGSTTEMRGMLYNPRNFDMGRLSRITEPGQFVNTMLGMGFPRNTAVQNLIREFVEMPQAAIDAGVDDRSYYNCLDCYPQYTALITFDPVAFTEALEADIVAPMRDAESLFTDYPYLTRLTSSMSPEEMTLDPYFVLNRDMEEVSKERWATLYTDCSDGQDWSEAPRWIELSDGREIRVPHESWFWNGNSYSDYLTDLGATNALVIEDTSGSGQPIVISDNSDLASEALDAHNARLSDVLGLGGDDLGPTGTSVSACGGCSSTSGGGAWLGLLGGLLIGLRRRR